METTGALLDSTFASATFAEMPQDAQTPPPGQKQKKGAGKTEYVITFAIRLPPSLPFPTGYEALYLPSPHDTAKCVSMAIHFWPLTTPATHILHATLAVRFFVVPQAL